MKKYFAFLLAVLLCSEAFANSPKLKIDLNYSSVGRDYTATGYTAWEVGENPTITTEGITFLVENASGVGSLRSNWYKDGVTGGALLLGDGLKVDGADTAGAKIKMTISGLTAGTHTLLVYLNNVDNLEAQGGPCPMDISVDGNLVVDNIQPTMRALLPYDSQKIYLPIEVTAGKKVEILFEADVDAGGGLANNNICVNAVELNTPNVEEQAKTPSPADESNHVEVAGTELNLSWVAAPTAISHDVYFGTDSAAVANGEGLQVEKQTTTTYKVSNLNTHDTYYWRVDERDESGLVTEGNVWSFRLAQLAFPGAEGYGRFARGGRGGRVVHVTSLEDDVDNPTEGTFRYAVEVEKGPRTIVFDVSGLIQLTGRLSLSDDYITIAGQTAPGKGITIRNAPFGLSGADDVIVQNLRVRRGGIYENANINWGGDGMGMSGCNNSIVDHCSISWTIDEAFSSRNGNNISLQRILISEALCVAGHPNYPEGTDHGYAATIGGDIGSFHHNLLAHNSGRNWSLGGGLNGSGYYAGRLDIRNNVVYNWKNRATDGGSMELNFVNNYYKVGPSTTLFYTLSMEHEGTGKGTQRAYYDGNLLVDNSGASKAESDSSSEGVPGRRYTIRNGATVDWETWVDEPFFKSYVETESAKAAYKDVLSDVGCVMPKIDDHDVRIIDETRSGTYTYKGSVSGKFGLIDNEKDAGGWEDYPEIHRAENWDTDGDGMPNWWETYNSLNVDDATDAQTIFTDGYSNLEYYLQWMSELHYLAEVGEAVEVKLSDVFAGYVDYSPSYSIVSKKGGEASITSGVLKLTATGESNAQYVIKVTDSDGDTKERIINVFFSKTFGTYTVNYHLGVSGALNHNPAELDYGTMLTLLNPNASGYRFMGWYADENYTQPVRVLDGTSDSYDLWARWKKIGNFLVYPTVASQSLKISSELAAERIQIINMSGSVVKQIQTNAQETEVNISDLLSGMYVLRSLESGEQTKFVVKK
ncbi:MAG: T9SS type A sorting domain-containing protein [Mangrovibacterium sp.]